MLLSEICVLVSVGRPLLREDGSAICTVITQWSESRKTRNPTLLSHPRLPQPGGPGSRISIPQEQGGPIIPPDTGLIRNQTAYSPLMRQEPHGKRLLQRKGIYTDKPRDPLSIRNGPYRKLWFEQLIYYCALSWNSRKATNFSYIKQYSNQSRFTEYNSAVRFPSPT
jgi:hypothetical protein